MGNGGRGRNVTDVLVPSGQHKARGIDVVVKVMVRQEQSGKVPRVEAGLGYLPRRRGPAVDQDQVLVCLDGECGPVTIGSGRRTATPEDVDAGGGRHLALMMARSVQKVGVHGK
jgi:hypothetical protein